jgi:hypothetical protein
MKKLAFFVEGYTEQKFVEKLLIEIFGAKKIAVQIGKIQGGKSTPISITLINSIEINEDLQYYVLIYDCGGGSTVKSYILEQRAGLIKQKYSKIIGLLDVYPDFERKDIEKFARYLKSYIPTKDIEISFVLAVMEIEAWFLAEYNHFNKIDENLNVDLIAENLGFNPAEDDMEARDTPADDLKNCYQLVGKKYAKKQKVISKTIDALDFGSIYFETLNRVGNLSKLIEEIEDVFN